VEAQALAARAGYGTPQRVATGFDPRRLAVLSRCWSDEPESPSPISTCSCRQPPECGWWNRAPTWRSPLHCFPASTTVQPGRRALPGRDRAGWRDPSHGGAGAARRRGVAAGLHAGVRGDAGESHHRGVQLVRLDHIGDRHVPSPRDVGVVIVAGSGTRIGGDTPSSSSRSPACRCCCVDCPFARHPSVAHVVVVLGPWMGRPAGMAPFADRRDALMVAGGSERSDSVAAGIAVRRRAAR
jgi:hypothetical protein